MKFVQAAVAAEAKGPIDFKLFRKRTQITLQNPEEWTSEFILDLFQGKVSSFSRAAGHLRMGLLGALGDGNQKKAWTCQGTTCTLCSIGQAARTQVMPRAKRCYANILRSCLICCFQSNFKL